MRFETKHPDILISILEATKTIAGAYDELYLIFENDKVSIRQMNGGKTMMIVSDLYPSYFDGYNPEGSDIITVDMYTMLSRIKGFKGYKRLLVETVKDGSMIRLYGEKGKVKRKIDVPVVVSDMLYKIEPPQVQYDFIARLKSNNFSNYIKDCTLIDDNYTVIEKVGEFLNIYAGNYDGKASNEINIAEDMTAIITKDVKSVFVTESLFDLISAGKPLSAIVQIGVKTDFPIQLKFEMEHGFVTLYLAPVILPDEE